MEKFYSGAHPFLLQSPRPGNMFSRLFPPPFDWLRETPARLVHPGSRVLIPSEVIVLLMEVMSRHLFSKLQVWSWIARESWMKKRELRDCAIARNGRESKPEPAGIMRQYYRQSPSVLRRLLRGRGAGIGAGRDLSPMNSGDDRTTV